MANKLLWFVGLTLYLFFANIFCVMIVSGVTLNVYETSGDDGIDNAITDFNSIQQQDTPGIIKILSTVWNIFKILWALVTFQVGIVGYMFPIIYFIFVSLPTILWILLVVDIIRGGFE